MPGCRGGRGGSNVHPAALPRSYAGVDSRLWKGPPENFSFRSQDQVLCISCRMNSPPPLKGEEMREGLSFLFFFLIFLPQRKKGAPKPECAQGPQRGLIRPCHPVTILTRYVKMPCHKPIHILQGHLGRGGGGQAPHFQVRGPRTYTVPPTFTSLK